MFQTTGPGSEICTGIENIKNESWIGHQPLLRMQEIAFQMTCIFNTLRGHASGPPTSIVPIVYTASFLSTWPLTPLFLPRYWHGE